MIRAGIHGDARSMLHKALREKLAFKTSGALKGGHPDDRHIYVSTGNLNDAETARYYADRDRMVYMVFSYATPIAWVLEDGTVYKVSQKFSITTTKHQGALYLL